MEMITTSSLGLFIGLLMGLTGAGGGIVAVPALVYFLHLNIAEAGPIALMAVASSAGIGALIAYRNKTLRYKAALLIGLAGLTTAPFGLWLAHQVPNRPLAALFGLILIGISMDFFLKKIFGEDGAKSKPNNNAICQLNNTTGKLSWAKPCFVTLLSVGAVSGFLSGLLGVGGGFVIVPALRRYTNLATNSIISASLGVMAIIAIGSSGISALAGTLNLPIATIFSVGAIIGLLISRQLSQNLNPLRIQQIFASFTFLVGMYMLCKSFLNIQEL
jgi:uncharacterized membrane protein YfcA